MYTDPVRSVLCHSTLVNAVIRSVVQCAGFSLKDLNRLEPEYLKDCFPTSAYLPRSSEGPFWKASARLFCGDAWNITMKYAWNLKGTSHALHAWNVWNLKGAPGLKFISRRWGLCHFLVEFWHQLKTLLHLASGFWFLLCVYFFAAVPVLCMCAFSCLWLVFS